MPSFCPGCGKSLELDSCVVFEEPCTGDEGWDIYCEKCDWSGDVVPDVPSDEPLEYYV